MKYMLIEVIERDISEPKFFDTYEEAYAEMVRRYNEVYEDDCEDDDNRCINEMSAYGETKNHDNIDWRIFPIPGYRLAL